MHHLFIEFDPFTTIDSLNTSLVCPLLVGAAQWCDVNPPQVFVRQLRLMAMQVRVPPHFSMHDTTNLTRLFQRFADFDNDNHVTFATVGAHNTTRNILFVTYLYVFFFLYILVVYALIFPHNSNK